MQIFPILDWLQKSVGKSLASAFYLVHLVVGASEVVAGVEILNFWNSELV